jgi:general secretion pathway protein K
MGEEAFVNRSMSTGEAAFGPGSDPRRGEASALIVVLWIIGLLSVLVISLTFDSHIEARIVSYYRKRTKAEYLARSGLEIAVMLMGKSADIRGTDEEEDEDDPWFEPAKALRDGAVRGLTNGLGEGMITLDIVPEPARRNINNLDVAGNKNILEIESNMERILEVGGITEDTGLWPELIDAFVDWIDTDEAPRYDGGETEDHYSQLEPPYEAKNGPLDTVEELLLVKGFGKTVLSGGSLSLGEDEEDRIPIRGIGDLLTTYGDGRVNVNAANPEVLMTLPGIDDLIAGAIVEERLGLAEGEGEGERTPFESPEEFLARMQLPGTLKKYITTDSKIYRITSVGTVHGVDREVWCIVEYDSKKRSMNILRWREQD